jgi:hypothetical protein
MNICNVDLMIDMKKLKTKLDNTMYRWNLKKDIQHLFFYKDIESDYMKIEKKILNKEIEHKRYIESLKELPYLLKQIHPKFTDETIMRFNKKLLRLKNKINEINENRKFIITNIKTIQSSWYLYRYNPKYPFCQYIESKKINQLNLQ